MGVRDVGGEGDEEGAVDVEGRCEVMKGVDQEGCEIWF